MDRLTVDSVIEEHAHLGHHASAEHSLRLRWQVWHFVRHYLEMCVAMCLGMAIFRLVVLATGQVGYLSLLSRYPELMALVLALAMTVPMTAWMRVRGMRGRLLTEMAGVTMAVYILLVGLESLGILARGSVLELGCTPGCLAMFIPMFFRLDHYTGKKACH